MSVAPPPQTAPAPSRPRRSPVRGSTLLVVLALSLTAAGVVYLRSQSGITVVVTTRNLPAYHLVGQIDVTERTLARSSLPAGFESDEDAVVGKYTQVAVKRSKVLGSSELGPPLAVPDLNQLHITALDATPAQALAGVLGPGDRVSLLLFTASSSRPFKILHNVLVLDASETAQNQYVVVFALDSNQAAAYSATSWSDWRLIRDQAFLLP